MINQPKGHLTLWCNFDHKQENHTTKKCYSCIQYMRGQAMGGMPNVGQDGERPVLVLERELPLPTSILVRLVGHEYEKEQEQSLMPMMPYGEQSSHNQREEEPKWMRNMPMNYQEQQLNMDYNTFMFIARQGRMPIAPKRAPNIPSDPCSIIWRITSLRIVHILGN